MPEDSASRFDTIVIGLGGVGSSACYHLAKRGERVLGLDRFPAGHTKGSSHGETRLIRKAYFEDPRYVPLLRRAYELWEQLEKEVGDKVLFRKQTVVHVGPPDGVLVPGVLMSAEEHNMKVTKLEKDEFAKRFPCLVLPDGCVAVVEHDAGFLFVEECVFAHLQIAEKHGAVFKRDCSVVKWESREGNVVVHTANGDSYEGTRLVIAAGAWSAQLLVDLKLELRVLRKHLHWFESSESTHADSGFPVFMYETMNGCFYGFPKLHESGLKVAEHSGGSVVDNPFLAGQDMEEGDCLRVEKFIQTYLKEVSKRRTRHESCLYTMSPDEYFIIDMHPQYSNVAFAAGLSGHGFKFTSVLGEALTNMVLGGGSPLSLPIEFLSMSRFSHLAN